MPLYNEERQGESPEVRGAGTGSLVVDWKPQPTGFQQSSQVLGAIMQTLDQEETDRRKKLKEKADMYNTLREAGYDPKAAYEAVARGALPSTPPGKTAKEEKDEADLAKTRSETRLADEKAAAYARGDIGKRKSAADKMNAAQLQREIKRVSDPFENPDYDSEETKSYLSHLNQRLQQLAQFPGAGGSQPPAEAPPAKPAAAAGKIRVRRKADGQTGTISAASFDPAKYEKI